MDTLAEKLDRRLRQWKPETVAEVRARVAEIMALADQDALDLLRSRLVEQEVLDVLSTESCARTRQLLSTQYSALSTCS